MLEIAFEILRVGVGQQNLLHEFIQRRLFFFFAGKSGQKVRDRLSDRRAIDLDAVIFQPLVDQQLLIGPVLQVEVDFPRVSLGPILKTEEEKKRRFPLRLPIGLFGYPPAVDLAAIDIDVPVSRTRGLRRPPEHKSHNRRRDDNSPQPFGVFAKRPNHSSKQGVHPNQLWQRGSNAKSSPASWPTGRRAVDGERPAPPDGGTGNRPDIRRLLP